VRHYELTGADEKRIAANHAFTILQHHIVMATWGRRGVFGDQSAEDVSEHWQNLLRDVPAALVTLSFVPDHVHVALRVHPSASPAELIVCMMNAAQEFIFQQYGQDIIRAKLERLWQPSAYLGSYGELQSSKIAAYIKNWERAER
jgi:REP element-mobilizing transposase RayT